MSKYILICFSRAQKIHSSYHTDECFFACRTSGDFDICNVFFLFEPYLIVSRLSRDFDKFRALFLLTNSRCCWGDEMAVFVLSWTV